MRAREFALAYYSKKTRNTMNEKALRNAIAVGSVTPDMSLREMGKVIGTENPQLIRHYLLRFLKETEATEVEDE